MFALDRLTIQRFRGLRDLTLSGLGRVNLLVGPNNSGKTSVLEAIALFCQPLAEEGLSDFAFGWGRPLAFGGLSGRPTPASRRPWHVHAPHTASNPLKTKKVPPAVPPIGRHLHATVELGIGSPIRYAPWGSVQLRKKCARMSKLPS